ncbi:MAG: tetratricopeptide repeat protein [Blastocatellia bacterium]
MKLLILQLAIVCLSVSAAVAQDPVKVAPQAYKLEFENDHVKVQRVYYGPRVKIPEHDHTAFGAAYVYLTDAGPVVFKHVGLSYGAVTRPAVKARSFRLYKAVKETHEVENLGDTPSDFLRVEFKTEPAKDPNTLRGKFFREDVPAGENLQKVQFENEQVRITRLLCAAGKSCEFAPGATEASLLIALTAVHLTPPRGDRLNLMPGQTRWLPAGAREPWTNAGKEAAEWLRFDFKTAPLKKAEAKQAHEHEHTATLPDFPALSLDGFDPEIKERVQKAWNQARAKPRDAAANGALGMTLHAHEQYEFAAICYERAYILAPSEFRWAYYLGVVRAELGRQHEAAEAFKAALRQQPNQLPAQLRLAETLLADGRLDESRQFYEAVAKRDPGLAQTHYGLGRIAAAAADSATAVIHYRKALDLFADYGAAHYALGMALRDQGRTAEAREHLALSQRLKLSRPRLEDSYILAIAETNAGASKHLRRAALLESAGKIAESIEEHQRALEINPQLVQAHINLISLYGRAGQIEKAEKHYRAAVGINPDLPDLHYNFGVLLVGQERYNEAAQAFRQCLQFNPYYAEAHHNYAVIIEREGRLDEAAGHYRKAIENKPGYRSAHFHLGRILVNQDKPREAIAQFLQTLTPEDEETPRFTYALGATYIRTGDRQTGIHHLREALKRASALNQTQLANSIERDLKTLEPKQ